MADKPLKKVPMYIKNVARSTIYAGQDFIGNVMPTTANFVETNSKVLKSVTSDLRNYKSTIKQTKKWMQDDSNFKSVKDVKNNFIDDLKTGNWYNKRRSQQAILDSSGFGDLFSGFEDDFNLDSDSSSGSDTGNISEGDMVTASAINNSAQATISSMEGVGKGIADTVANGTGVIIDNQNSINSKNTVIHYRMFNEINSVLNDMGNNLRGLFEYTNNITEYFNASMKMTEDIANKIEEMTAYNREMAEMKRNQYLEFTESKNDERYKSDNEAFLRNGFDIKAYLDTVKKRAKETYESSMLGSSMSMMGDDPLSVLAGSPAKFLSQALFNKMVSKDVRSSMGTLDDTMSNFFKSAFLKMSSGLREKGTSMGSGIFDTIANIIGVKLPNAGSMTTNKYVKGPVPFNGYSDRALTEVIPTYLRKILSAITGQEEMIYDYEAGKFSKITDVKKSYDEDVKNSYNGIGRTKNAVNKAIGGYAMNRDSRKMMDEDVEEFFQYIVDNGYFYNPNTANYDDMSGRVTFRGGRQSFDMINNAFKAMGREKWNAFNGDIYKTITNRQDFVNDISKNGSKKGYGAVDNGFEIDTDKKFLTGLHAVDKYNKTVFDYMRDIRTLLLEGIKVFSMPLIPSTIPSTPFNPDARMNRYDSEVATIVENNSGPAPEDENELRRNATAENRRYIGNVRNNTDSEDDQVSYFRTVLGQTATEEATNSVLDTVRNSNVGSMFTRMHDLGRDIAGVPGTIVKGILDSVNDNLLFFLYGSKGGQGKSFFELAREQLEKTITNFMNLINTKIIQPLNFRLFDEDTGIVPGIRKKIQPFVDKINTFLFGNNSDKKGLLPTFKEKLFGDGTPSNIGVINHMKNAATDTKNAFVNSLIGKSYTDSNGNFHDAKTDNLLTHMKQTFTSVTDYFKNLFSRADTTSFLGKAFGFMDTKIAKFSNFAFGTDVDKMTPSEFYNKHVSSRMPKLGVGLGAGALLSFMTPLGLLGGTMMGGSVGLLSSSSRFKNLLFGESVDGERTGGVISKEFQSAFKTSLPSIYKGIGIGALSSFIGPFGLLGGSLLGGSMGFLSTTDKFKTFMFGDGGDNKGIISKEFYEKHKMKLVTGAKGAGIGMIGGFFLPGGPIGGALAGLAIGIASQSDHIKRFLFGDKTDPANIKYGLMDKLQLWVKTEVMDPFKLFAKDMFNNISYFVKKEMINPVLEVFAPVKKEIGLIKDRIVERLTGIKDGILDLFDKKIIAPMHETLDKYVLDPIKNTFGKLFKGLAGMLKGIITLPSKMINKAGMNLMNKHLADGDADYYDDWLKSKKERDVNTENKYNQKKTDIKAQRQLNKYISKLMRQGKFDPSDPAVQKALGWQNSGISTTKLETNTSETNNILTSIRDWLNSFYDLTKEKYKNVKNKRKNKNESGNGTGNINEPDSNIPKPNNNPNTSSQPSNNSNSSPHVGNINEPNSNIPKPNNIDANNTPNDNSNTSSQPSNNSNSSPQVGNIVTETPINNTPKENKNATHSSDTKFVPSDASDLTQKTAKSMNGHLKIISDSVDGQLNGVGYNTELIARILEEQFGTPSVLPKGVRSGMHKIKGIFSEITSFFRSPINFVKGFVGGIIAKPLQIATNIITGIFKPMAKVVGGLVSAIASVPKLLLTTLGTLVNSTIKLLTVVGEGAVGVIKGVFGSLPAVAKVLGTALAETTKVVGGFATEVAKGLGASVKYMIKGITALGSGLIKIASEIIPSFIKASLGAIGFIAKTGVGIVKGALSLVTSPFRKMKVNTNMTEVTLVHLVREVDSVKEVGLVKEIGKINDSRLHSGLEKILNAIRSNKSEDKTNKSDIGNIDDPELENNGPEPHKKSFKEKVADVFKSAFSNNGPKTEVVNNSTIPMDAMPNKTGNIQVDRFKNKINKEKEDKSNKDKANSQESANKANRGTFDILNNTFGKRSLFKTIGSLLLLGLPKLFDFIKNFKKNVIDELGNIIGKLIGKIKLPSGLGGKGATSTNTSRTGTNGGGVNTKTTTESKGGTGVVKGAEEKVTGSKGGGSVVKGLPGSTTKGGPKALPGGVENPSGSKPKGLPGQVESGKTGYVNPNDAKYGKGNIIENVDYKVAEERVPTSGKFSGILGKVGAGLGKIKLKGIGGIATSAAGAVATNYLINKAVGSESTNTGSFTQDVKNVAEDTGAIYARVGAKKAFISNGNKIANKLATDGSIVSKIMESAPVKKLLGSKIGAFSGKISEFILNRLKNSGGEIFTKLAAKWSAIIGTGTVTAGIIPALWYGGEIINGVSATNRMFNLSPNYKPTNMMRMVAGVSAFLSNNLTMGMIPADTIAQFIGSLVLPQDELAKLSEGQSQLNQEYEQYKESSGDELSLDDYNQKVNKSFVDKAWDGVKSVGSGIADGAKWAGNKISQGASWAGNKISQGASWAGNKISQGASWAGNKISQGASWAGNKIAQGAQWVGDKASAGLNAIKNYEMNNSFLSAFNDDKIRSTLGLNDNVSINTSDRVSMGVGSSIYQLSFGTIDQQSATKAVKGAILQAQDAWKSVENRFSQMKKDVEAGAEKFNQYLGSIFGLQDSDGNPISFTDWAGNKISDAGQAIKDVTAGAINEGKYLWNQAGNLLGQAKNNVINGAANFDNYLGSVFGLQDSDGNPVSLTSWVSGGISTIANDISQLASSAYQSGKDLWNNAGQKFDSIKQSVEAGAKKLDAKLGALFGLDDGNGNSVSLTQYIGDKTDQFVSGVKAKYNGFKSWLNNIFNKDTASQQSRSDQDSANRNDEGGNGEGDTGVVSTQLFGTSPFVGGSGDGDGLVNGAVYYSQNDPTWGGTAYGSSGTISTSGCGPTSAAMLLSSVTGQTITPEDAATYSVNNGFRIPGVGTSWDFFKSIGDQYGVNLSQTGNVSDAKSALQSGYPVILSGKGAPPFTKGGHFVMATGMTSDGQIIINDPVSKERSKAYDFDQVVGEAAQAWISDKPLTGGAATSASGSSGGSTSGGTGNTKAPTEADTDPFSSAFSQLAKLTTGFVSAGLSNQVFDPSKLEPQQTTQSAPSGGSTGGNYGSLHVPDGIAVGTEALSSDVQDYISAFNDAGSKYGVDPGVLEAISMQESGGDKNAGYPNHAAWGLMQIENTLGEEFAQYGQDNGGGAYTLQDRLDPTKAIPFAAYRLSSDLAHYNGDYIKTIQAYNFSKYSEDMLINKYGDDWLAHTGEMGNINGVGSPYGDKNYVSHVLRYYHGGGNGEGENKSFGNTGVMKNGGNGTGESSFGKINKMKNGGNGNVSLLKPKVNFGNFKIIKNGGNGNTDTSSTVTTPLYNASDFILHDFQKTNNELNNHLTAQDVFNKSNMDPNQFSTLIELVKQIADNTSDIAETNKEIAQNTAEIADKNTQVNVIQNANQQPQTNSGNNNSTKYADAFTQISDSSATNKITNAYNNARQIAMGIK